jgi:hypothetical protein
VENLLMVQMSPMLLPRPLPQSRASTYGLIKRFWNDGLQKRMDAHLLVMLFWFFWLCKDIRNHSVCGNASLTRFFATWAYFTPTFHEPCLYVGLINEQWVLFMHQVDDFAVAAPNEQIANQVFNMLDD